MANHLAKVWHVIHLPSGGKEPQHLTWYILQHLQKVRSKWFCQSCHTCRIQKAP